MIKGIEYISKVITEKERVLMRDAIKKSYISGKLTEEGVTEPHAYGNSFGSQIQFSAIQDRLTAFLSKRFNVNLTKSGCYSRIYFKGGKLNSHIDREGLDLTLTVQLESTFKRPSLLKVLTSDNTQHQFFIGDLDGVLVNGRELTHWRDEIKEEGQMINVFFHWKIDGLQYKHERDAISNKKCRLLIKDAEKAGFTDSRIAVNGRNEKTDHRTSKQAFIKDDLLDQEVRKRIGDMRLEGWSILKYEKGQEFKEHLDNNGAEINSRLFTILVYLNTNFKGGKTYFPNQDLTVNPNVGDMFIFKSLRDGMPDANSLHSSTPIEEGVKYIAVNWALIGQANGL